MNTLYMMIGLPGSGKSTIAKELSEYLDIPVISSDSIRKELTGSEENFDFEGRIWGNEIPARLNTSLLIEDVVFDATNLKRSDRTGLTKHLVPHEKVAIFVDVPLEECIARQELRSRKVPVERIEEMYYEELAMPVKDEGFSEIYIVKSGKDLIEKIGKDKEEYRE